MPYTRKNIRGDLDDIGAPTVDMRDDVDGERDWW